MLELDSNLTYGTDGSGDQKKIWVDNYLYKVDSQYRESTKEVSASNIAEAFGIYHVTYKRLKCKVDGVEKWCSVCKSFLRSNEDQSINLYNILSYYDNFIVTDKLPTIDYFNGTCNIIRDFTNLDINYIKERIIQMLVFDFLIVNDDRHLRNIEIIFNKNTFDIAPIFDNGHSFFRKDSITTYKELENLSRKYKPKPFSTNQWKNIIDIEYAKYMTNIWLNNVKQTYGDINSIPNTLESHKRVLKYRMKLLLNK